MTDFLYFEDFAPGQVYPGQSRKLDEEAFLLFARITGNHTARMEALGLQA